MLTKKIMINQFIIPRDMLTPKTNSPYFLYFVHLFKTNLLHEILFFKMFLLQPPNKLTFLSNSIKFSTQSSKHILKLFLNEN